MGTKLSGVLFQAHVLRTATSVRPNVQGSKTAYLRLSQSTRGLSAASVYLITIDDQQAANTATTRSDEEVSSRSPQSRARGKIALVTSGPYTRGFLPLSQEKLQALLPKSRPTKRIGHGSHQASLLHYTPNSRQHLDDNSKVLYLIGGFSPPSIEFKSRPIENGRHKPCTLGF